MTDKLLSLLPSLIFWLVLMIVATILVRRTGLSRNPLNTANNKITSFKKKLDDFAASSKRIERDEDGKVVDVLTSLTNFQLLTEAKKISIMMKDAKKAHDALAVYCYDNRLNSDASAALETVEDILELLPKLSKGVFKTAKEYGKLLNSLISQTNKAVKQIELCTR
ncbi:MAG: hypothetical protein K6F82_02340 [Sphaerochaetaceae bacterium]|nr:hypothetical protein [Sphaerochaetaceae bacterium]